MSRFDTIQPRVLRHEGGYVNHPRDPGGATNKGVTQRTYNAYLERVGRPAQSVRNITSSEIARIYRAQYWNVVRGDQLPDGVDYTVYDFAVNSGPSRAAKHLQRAVGVPADGVIGEITLAAVARTDAQAIIERVNASRMAFLRGLRHWGTFGRGWTRRVTEVRSTSLDEARAVGQTAPQIYEPTELEPMAKAPDSQVLPSRAPEAAGGLVSGVVATLAPLGLSLVTASESAPVLQYALAGVIVAVTVAAGVWFTRNYLRKQNGNSEVPA